MAKSRMNNDDLALLAEFLRRVPEVAHERNYAPVPDFMKAHFARIALLHKRVEGGDYDWEPEDRQSLFVACQWLVDEHQKAHGYDPVPIAWH